MARQTVAVVGGGCAGVLVTRELLRCSDDNPVLIEPDTLGGGPAYGAAQPWHLLNSRAGAMSADADDPQQFVRWARAHGIPAGPDDFLLRRDFGRYLRAALASTVAAAPGRLTHHRSRVAAIRPDGAGCAVELDDGSTVRADHAVLALGSPGGGRPPAVPAALDRHRGYVGDPWRAGALDGVPAGAPVLLIGTGLTAVDVALSLTAGGRGARLTAVSRRGQVPQAHIAATPACSSPAVPPPPIDGCHSLRDLVRTVRASTVRASAIRASTVRADTGQADIGQAGDWRTVVDGLRPYLDGIWSGLAPGEQEAFLRHLARYWESHRHRMAPSVAARVAALRADGVLRVLAGGIRSVTAAAGGGFDVVLGGGEPQWFAAVVNCAGPGRLPASAGPLVDGLLTAGLARVGPHGLGLDIDGAGRLIGRDGTVRPRLWVVGPLRRGVRWETTAVPEIRAQAVQVTGDLARHRPMVLSTRRARPLREPRLDAA
jgi:uncharacterized NAD(P)/FAD-binding protein YdhS